MQTDLDKLMQAYRFLTYAADDGCAKLELYVRDDASFVATIFVNDGIEARSWYIHGRGSPTAGEAIDSLKAAIDEQIRAKIAKLETLLTDHAKTAKV